MPVTPTGPDPDSGAKTQPPCSEVLYRERPAHRGRLQDMEVRRNGLAWPVTAYLFWGHIEQM